LPQYKTGIKVKRFLVLFFKYMKNISNIKIEEYADLCPILTSALMEVNVSDYTTEEVLSIECKNRKW